MPKYEQALYAILMAPPEDNSLEVRIAAFKRLKNLKASRK